MNGFDSFLWEEILINLPYPKVIKLRIVSNYFNTLIECSNKIHRNFLFSNNFKYENFENKTGLQIFTRLCCIGYLDLVKWVARRYNITRENILFNDSRTFRNACVGNEFEIAKWLAKTFDLEEEDIRVRGDEALQWIGRINGNLKFLRWIVKRFNIEPENKGENIVKYGDSKGVFVGIINNNCIEGRVEVVKWLLKKYPELSGEIRAYNVERGIGSLCNYSCSSVNDETKLFRKVIKFSELLNPERKVILHQLGNICKNFSVEFLIKFLDHFKVEKEEFLENYPIISICSSAKVKILEEVARRYNLSYKTSSKRHRVHSEIGFLYACVGNICSDAVVSDNARLLMVKYLVEKFGMDTRQSTIDSSSSGCYHFAEMATIEEDRGAPAKIVKYLTKYFKLSKLEFRERATGDFYCEHIGYIKDKHKYTKEERDEIRDKQYQEWLDSEDSEDWWRKYP